MIHGYFRDGHPRVILSLPGRTEEINVEFVVDTGYAGDLSLPESIANNLDAAPAGTRYWSLADGSLIQCSVLQVFLAEDEQERFVQVVVLPGNPLLGTDFLREQLLQIEMTEGGEVTAEPL